MMVAEKPTEYYVTWPNRATYERLVGREGTTDIDLADYYEDEDATTLRQARALARRLAPKALNGEVTIMRRVNISEDAWFDWQWDTEEVGR